MSDSDTLVTILFADISHSTGLYERLGDSKARDVISRALDIMGREAADKGGRLVKTIGDEIMCAFDAPVAAAEAAQHMHESVFKDSILNGHSVSVRIGMHCGEAILEQGDYFGDAVNVAARATGMSKADQIILTLDVADHLPKPLRNYLRNIGRMRVEGKTVDMDFFELHWRIDEDTLTIMAGTPEARVAPTLSRLVLRAGDQQWEILPADPPLQLGRDERNDLVLTTRYTSRRHASIRYLNGRYLLKDFSINGTYLYPDNNDPVFLLREEAVLDDKGIISFGQAMEEEGSVPFAYTVDSD